MLYVALILTDFLKKNFPAGIFRLPVYYNLPSFISTFSIADSRVLSNFEMSLNSQLNSIYNHGQNI